MTHIDIVWPAQFAAEIANFDGVVMVDFWAARCGPCRMLAPVLHQATEDSHGKVKLLKIDVDEDQNQALAMQFGVSSIPQVTFFVGWQKVDQFVGVQWPDSVTAIIEKHLPAAKDSITMAA
jgi:thioredoxin